MKKNLLKIVLSTLFTFSTITPAQSSLPPNKNIQESKNQDGTIKIMCCVSNGGKGG